jgi:hypothetical protein
MYKYIRKDATVLSWLLFQKLYMFRAFTMPIIRSIPLLSLRTFVASEKCKNYLEKGLLFEETSRKHVTQQGTGARV